MTLPPGPAITGFMLLEEISKRIGTECPEALSTANGHLKTTIAKLPVTNQNREEIERDEEEIAGQYKRAGQNTEINRSIELLIEITLALQGKFENNNIVEYIGSALAEVTDLPDQITTNDMLRIATEVLSEALGYCSEQQKQQAAPIPIVFNQAAEAEASAKKIGICY